MFISVHPWLRLLLFLVLTMSDLGLISAALGRPLAWAYGKHIVGGNVILRDDTDPAFPVMFIALGEGEWDGYEVDGGGVPKLYLNGAQLAASEIHFHPGIAGALSGGGGLTPESTGGDNKVDLWFPTGGGLQPTTFSQLAYVALKFNSAEIDPSQYDFRGIFRTRKIQWYDSSGTPTVYEYSDNPIRQVADLLLKVRGLAVADLDWAQFTTEAAYCDALITIGVDSVKRFVSHPAWADLTDLDSAIADVLGTCRGVLTENPDTGKIGVRIDKVRAPVFTFTPKNSSGFSWKALDTSGAANRYDMVFRDPDNGNAEVPKRVDHEAQQTRIGKKIPAKIALAGMPQHQAERIANYRLTRAIDLNEQVNLRGDPSSSELMPGDVVNVVEWSAPWELNTNETFEVEECTYEPDGSREFLLRLYRDTTYSDAAGVGQNLQQTTIQKQWGGDGTSDTGVPDTSAVPGTWGVFAGSEQSDTRAQIGAIVVEYAAPADLTGVTNWAGVDTVEAEVKSWADAAGTTDAQTKVFAFPFFALENARLVMNWEGRYVESVKLSWRNSYGWSTTPWTVAAWTAPNLIFLAGAQTPLMTLLGLTAPQQVSGGPEYQGFKDAVANRVCVAQWFASEANARFLRDLQGNHEWKGPDPDSDQNILMGWSSIGRLSLQGIGGGGLNIVAWKHTYLNGGITDVATTATVLSGAALGWTSGSIRCRIENEIVYVTNVTGNTVTMSRGEEGTTPAAHSTGLVFCRLGTPEDQPRLALNNDGAGLLFTNGAVANGGSLYLADTGILNFLLPSSGSVGVGILRSGDTFHRLYFSGDNMEIKFGPGNAALDVFLTRTAANTLAVKPGSNAAGVFRVLTAAGGDALLVDTNTIKLTVYGDIESSGGELTGGAVNIGATEVIDGTRKAFLTALDVTGAVTFDTDLAVAHGGTGASTASTARANLGAAASAGITGHVTPLAKLTPGGTNGSITYNSDGIVTASVDPT